MFNLKMRLTKNQTLTKKLQIYRRIIFVKSALVNLSNQLL